MQRTHLCGLVALVGVAMSLVAVCSASYTGKTKCVLENTLCGDVEHYNPLYPPCRNAPFSTTNCPPPYVPPPPGCSVCVDPNVTLSHFCVVDVEHNKNCTAPTQSLLCGDEKDGKCRPDFIDISKCSCIPWNLTGNVCAFPDCLFDS